MRKIHVLFLMPTLLILFVLIVLPLGSVIHLSMTNAATYSQHMPKWVGLENYVAMVADEQFWQAIVTTLILSSSTVLIQLIVGLSYALALRRVSRGTNVVRGIILIPMVLPPVVVGVLWRMFFAPTMPGINWLLSVVGINGPDWFGKTWSALASIILATSWQWIPFVFLMLLAGLESISNTYYESARIDGASSIQQFYFITLPLLKRVLVFVAIYRMVESVRIFPIVYVLTGGGPGTSTQPINYYIWIQAFSQYNMGYASSLVVATLVLLGVLIGAFLAIGRRMGAIR